MSEQEPRFTGLFEHELAFESYGVRIKLLASNRELLDAAAEAARSALVGNFRILENCDAEHSFGIAAEPSGEILFLFQNGVQTSYDTRKDRFLKFFDSLVRIVVAEHAVGWVFVHAGAVVWKGRAIVVPGNSFSGKTTLVGELVKQGAAYLSDEYAVLDPDGMVHAFARDLSVRLVEGSTVSEKSVPVHEFGGAPAPGPVPVGLLLLTEYAPDAVWNPNRLSVGRGIMEVIPHTIPRNFNAEFSLKVLNRALRDAIILQGLRGDAAAFAIKLLSFFDNSNNLAKIT